MTARFLRIVLNILTTTLVFMVAIGVWFMFRRVIDTPDPATFAQNRAERATPSPTVPFPGAPQPTVEPSEAGGITTTSAVATPTCQEPQPVSAVGIVLTVYFTCGPSTFPTADSFVYRDVPATDLVLTTTLEELVKGPDDEERAAGFVSFFSEATADSFRGVTLSDGRATIDLSGLEDINNISTSTGSEFFLANLNANVFQFDTIDAVEYRLNGTCDDFWNLLQRDCQLVTRAEWERQLATYQSQG
jgi:hypothetical protein